VVAADGFTYERVAIRRWMLSHNTSPMTGEQLADRLLRVNKLAASLVQQLLG
jgi:U-box domain